MNLTRIKIMKRYVILILLISMCGGESTEDVRNTDQTLQTEVQPTDEILKISNLAYLQHKNYENLSKEILELESKEEIEFGLKEIR